LEQIQQAWAERERLEATFRYRVWRWVRYGSRALYILVCAIMAVLVALLVIHYYAHSAPSCTGFPDCGAP